MDITCINLLYTFYVSLFHYTGVLHSLPRLEMSVSRVPATPGESAAGVGARDRPLPRRSVYLESYDPSPLPQPLAQESRSVEVVGRAVEVG